MVLDAIKWPNKDSRLARQLPITTMVIGIPAGRANFFICKHAYFALLVVKQRKYDTMSKAATYSNILPMHKLTSQQSNSSLPIELEACLTLFFDNLVKLVAPRATRFIQLEVGMKVLDSNDELLELPLHWCKQHLYTHFCEDLGHTAPLKSDTGAYKYTRIPDGEDNNSGNMKPCSIAMFLSFWFNHYSKIVIPKAREDICNTCFILSN